MQNGGTQNRIYVVKLVKLKFYFIDPILSATILHTVETVGYNKKILSRT